MSTRLIRVFVRQPELEAHPADPAQRRSFARDAVDSGNDPHVVCRVGGWKTMTVMNRYNIVDTKRMAAALTRLEDARKATPATATVAPFAQAAETRPRKKHGK